MKKIALLAVSILLHGCATETVAPPLSPQDKKV